MTRAPKVLLVLVAVGVIGVTVALLLGKIQEVKRLQEQVRTTQQQAAALEAENLGLVQQVKTLQAERKALDERVASLHTQLATVTTDLERSRLSLGELEDQHTRLMAQLEQARTQAQAQVSQLTSQRDEAVQHVRQLEGTKTELERSVSRWRERLALLDRDYRKLAEKLTELEQQHPPHPNLDVVTTVEPATGSAAAAPSVPPPPTTIPGTVELPPIIVRKDQPGMASMVRGRVVEVNDPHNFVVIDKGSTDGVRVGMSFDVLRGSSPVGRATVIRVRPTISACDIVRAKTPSPLQAGDLAIQSSP